MYIDRRRAILAALAFVSADPGSARAEKKSNFDPIAIAKLRIGEIVREISGSGRDQSVPEPSADALMNMGLLLQAGLRALLPVREREGVALPGKSSPSDPPELVEAQENYAAVFQSGVEASPEQKAKAFKSLQLAAEKLASAGYRQFSKSLSNWIKTHGR